MTDYILIMLPTLQHSGQLGYWFVLMIALLESLVIVGTVVPGAVLVTLAGFVSSQGYLDVGDLIWFAAIGSILGDILSYYLGSKGTKFLHSERSWLKEAHLDRAKKFFAKHGSKSVFFGRFIGPIRSVVPFVAGLSGMKRRSFLFWNILSGVLWAATHILLGYFFGSALKTIELWSGRAGVFFLALAVLIFFIWFFAKRSRPGFEFIKSISISIKRAVRTNPDVERLIKKHSALFQFLRHRLDRNKFSGLALTLLVVAFFYTLIMFFGIIEDIISVDPIVAADIRVANLLYVFRDPTLAKVFLWVTLFGKLQIIFTSAIIFSILCWLWQRRNYVLPLWVSIAGAGVFSYLGKLLIHRPRPEAPFYTEHSYSFPSGHATIAVAFYGFVAYALIRNFPRWKQKINPLFTAFILILAIGFSRLYLGVHFLSDVWGGYLLGFLWLIIAMSISEWMNRKQGTIKAPLFSRRKTMVVSTALLMIGALFYLTIALPYHPIQEQSVQPRVSPLRTDDIIQTFNDAKLPRYSETLLGNPQEPLNFIFVARDETALIHIMEKSGWNLADTVTVHSLAKIAEDALFNHSYPTAPITPSFWNAKVHDYGFEKPTNTATVRERHHFRVWKTNLLFTNGYEVYAATASLDIGLKWGITHEISPDIDTERELVFADLEKSQTIGNVQKEKFVDPILGKNFSGDQFFTDGNAYLILFQ